MQFSLNVAPLKSALDLAVVNSNISKFFEKSTVVELSVTGSKLFVNTQATALLSEVVIPGNNVDNGEASAIVDCSQSLTYPSCFRTRTQPLLTSPFPTATLPTACAGSFTLTCGSTFRTTSCTQLL